MIFSKNDSKPKLNSNDIENQITQREAVFQAVTKVAKSENIKLDVSKPIKEMLSETSLERVYKEVTQGFKDKKVILKNTEANNKKMDDEKLLRNYVIGLVNNWLRRDKRLNGKHEQ